jgi:site-specific recombinase XerD
MGGEKGIDGLTGTDVTAFLLAECTRLSVGSAKGLVGELRSLLRFLHLAGPVATALGDALPSVAGWHSQKLPPTLGSAAVAALLASCDRSSVVGRRDFAILTVLARLGLRAGEVVGMELDDVDWRVGELVVRGKGRRVDRLPLPADVGEALVDYLCQSRPRVERRRLFITCRAPWRPLHPNTVGRVVLFACRRAGLPPVRSHRLHHALAGEMVRRGAALEEVSQVLRHRDLATTAIYAKVDSDVLRSVAPEWPGSVA